MRYRITDESLVVMLYVLSASMLVGQFFEINIITSISFALSFIVVFVTWMLHLKDSNLIDVLAVLIVVASLIGPVITCNELFFGYFKNWLMFISVFLYFSVCIKIRINQITAKKLFKINLFVTIVCLVAYILFRDEAFYVSNIGVRYLKFGFYNPNSLALFLLCLALSGICHFSFYYEKKYRLIKCIYILFFAVLISQTLSRTALLALFLFLLIFVIFKRKNRHFVPRNNVFNLIVVLFPLLFSLIYMLLVDTLAKSGIFAFMISEGKGLDSRQSVWTYALDLLKASPIWGSYGELVTSTQFSQMHNSHLNVLVSYGFVVFLLVLVFLFIVLSDICKASRTNKTELSAWAFIICLILGAGEAVLFSGGLSFYLLVGQFLLLCNSYGNEESY